MTTKIQNPAPTAISRGMTDERLARRTAARPASTSRRLPGLARLAMVLEILLGIGAVGGGSLFILAPDGHLMGLPLKMLAERHSTPSSCQGSCSSPLSALPLSWRP